MPVTTSDHLFTIIPFRYLLGSAEPVPRNKSDPGIEVFGVISCRRWNCDRVPISVIDNEWSLLGIVVRDCEGLKGTRVITVRGSLDSFHLDNDTIMRIGDIDDRSE